MRNVVIGFVLALVVMVAVPLLVLGSGAFNCAATTLPTRFEGRLAGWALHRSLDRRAPRTDNPYADSPDALDVGMDHYKEMCVGCHGAPGVEPADLAHGLNPPAPKLAAEAVQEMSNGELFWIIKHGIRMTGMPGFGPTHNDEKIWKIVAFVRHLPHLTPQEAKQLGAGAGDDDDAHDAHGHEHSAKKPTSAGG